MLVVHAKFGEGIVIREDGDKLEIEFDGVGLKKLARGFIQEK